MSRKSSRWIFFLGLALLALGACRTSAPARYYLLSAASGTVAAPAAGGPAIGVGPIAFPDYLDRPQIVTRRGGSELELAELHRWAEPLASSFTKALADHLAAGTAAASVHAFPWPAGTLVDYRLKGAVTRFDADEGGRAVLEVRWQVADGDGAVLVPMRRSSYTQAAKPGDYGDMVTALDRTIAAWSAEVIGALDQARGE